MTLCLGLQNLDLTSLLHESKQLVQELFPLLVVAQLVKLKKKKRNLFRNLFKTCLNLSDRLMVTLVTIYCQMGNVSASSAICGCSTAFEWIVTQVVLFHCSAETKYVFKIVLL